MGRVLLLACVFWLIPVPVVAQGSLVKQGIRVFRLSKDGTRTAVIVSGASRCVAKPLQITELATTVDDVAFVAGVPPVQSQIDIVAADAAETWAVAERFRDLPVSPTLGINEAIAAIEAEGGTVYKWGFGESPFDPPPQMIEALARAAGRNRYAPNNGLPELRRAISEYYATRGVRFPANNVLIFPGTKNGLAQLITVLDADAVIIPAPYWVSYTPQARFANKDVFSVRTELSNGYKMTADQLRAASAAADGARGKVLILTSPNNPTGTVYTADEMRALMEVAREEKILVIYDGIYAHDTDFAGHALATPMQFYPEGTVLSSGLSKVHSAGGWRLGFLAFPEQMENVSRDLGALISDTIGSVPTPIQDAAVLAFNGTGGVLENVERAQQLHGAVGDYLYKRFQGMGLNVAKPEGAFYLYPDFDPYRVALQQKYGVETADDLTRVLFEQTNIAVLPSTAFGDDAQHLAFRVATGDFDGPAAFAAASDGVVLDDAFVEAAMPKIKQGADALEAFVKTLR